MGHENGFTQRTSGAAGAQEQPPVGDRLPERLAALLGARLYAALALLFLLALLFHYFDTISRVALIAFMGAIVALAFHSIVVRIPLRRGIATLSVALAALAVVGLVVWQGLAFLLPQLRSLATDLPRFQATVEEWQGRLREQTGLEVDLLGAPLEGLLQNPLGAGMALLSRAFGALEILGLLTIATAVEVFWVEEKLRNHRAPVESLVDT